MDNAGPVARFGSRTITYKERVDRFSGANVLDGSASTDPDGIIVDDAWNLDHDGQDDDATGVMPAIGDDEIDALGLAPG